MHTELLCCSHGADACVVEFLIAHGTCAQSVWSFVVRFVCSDDHVAAIRVLLQHGADVDTRECYLLNRAVEEGQTQVVKLALEYGARSDNAIAKAAEKGHGDVAKVLLAQSANNTAAVLRASHNCHMDVLQLLLDDGDYPPLARDLALQFAAKSGNVAMAELLIEHLADVTADDNSGLHVACDNGHLEVVKLLIQHKGDVRSDGSRALHNAAKGGYKDIVQLLIDHGADISAYDDYAVRIAAGNGHLDVVQMLLEIEGDIDTTLQWAAAGGHCNMVKLLIEYGADVTADDDTAIAKAGEHKFYAMVKLLVKYGADYNAAELDMPYEEMLDMLTHWQASHKEEKDEASDGESDDDSTNTYNSGVGEIPVTSFSQSGTCPGKGAYMGVCMYGLFWSCDTLCKRTKCRNILLSDHVYMYADMYMCARGCEHTWSVYVCMCICTYIHTYIHTCMLSDAQISSFHTSYNTNFTYVLHAQVRRQSAIVTVDLLLDACTCTTQAHTCTLHVPPVYICPRDLNHMVRRCAYHLSTHCMYAITHTYTHPELNIDVCLTAIIYVQQKKN